MKRKVVVGCMNGAFASDKALTGRIYMSDIIRTLLAQYFKKGGFAFSFQKGGMWNCPDRLMKDFILRPEYNNAKSNLILVGKSGGVWDFEKDILAAAITNCNYNQVFLFCVDGTYPLRMKPLKMPPCALCVNIFQTKGFLHGGSVIVPKGTQYVEFDVTGKGVDHFNIIKHPQVEKSFLNLLNLAVL